jgi:hypothetical protein
VTYRKLILADRIRSGAHARPRYRLAVQEGALWWKRTRIFVTYCEGADQRSLHVARPSWFEVHSRALGVTMVSQVEDEMLQVALTMFLQDAKINGDVR